MRANICAVSSDLDAGVCGKISAQRAPIEKQKLQFDGDIYRILSKAVSKMTIDYGERLSTLRWLN